MEITFNVTASPKCVMWIDREPAISDSLRAEMLKTDVLLTKTKHKEIHRLLKKHNDTKFYLFSLDGFINQAGVRKESDLFAKANDYSLVIENFVKDRSVVYTSYIDPKVEGMFKRNRIPIVIKNLNDDAIAIGFLNKLSEFFFPAGEARLQRGFLRLVMKDQSVKADIHIDDKRKISVIVRDISLNGAGFMADPRFLDLIPPKSLVMIKIYIPRFVIRIKKAVIVRVGQTGEMGVQFNIDDERMVDPLEVKTLSSFMMTCIKDLDNSNLFAECGN